VGKINEVLSEIKSKKRCNGCKKFNEHDPIIFEPKRKHVKVMVISESPVRLKMPESENSYKMSDPKFRQYAWSSANPLYLFLSYVFNGRFNSREAIYWTHYMKCYPGTGKGKHLYDNCAHHYLDDEIKAVGPELIIAVGKKTENYLKENRIHNEIECIFFPHPSGQNRRLWLEKWEVLVNQIENARERLKCVLKRQS
jgi:hypothetical protein